MAGALLVSTSLFCLLTLCPGFQCQEDSNATSSNTTNFRQDFWEIKVEYDIWLRMGCIMDSPDPTGRFIAKLSSENGTVLIQVTLMISTASHFIVYDYTTGNMGVFRNGTFPTQPTLEDTYPRYLAVKLNGSHFIMTDLNGWVVSLRTALQPSDIWNINFSAFLRGALLCLPRIDCGH